MGGEKSTVASKDALVYVILVGHISCKVINNGSITGYHKAEIQRYSDTGFLCPVGGMLLLKRDSILLCILIFEM